MEQYSVEAILSLTDKGFTSGLAKAESQVQKLMGKIGDISKGMVDVGSAVSKYVTAPVVAGTVAAIKSFGDLEQAYGGIETMFKGSAQTVIKNSQSAYERAGLSGTKYMEQVTSFSARLLQGLGGDTEKAAKIADVAMVDMADNANRFGTNIGEIQHAYQGFAKGNFAMLDNLKLGRKSIAEYKPSENGETLRVAA